MQKLGKALLAAVVIALFIVGLVCGLTLARLTGSGTAPRIHSTPAILKQVQALSELVTVKYVIEKVEVYEVPSQNVVGQMIGSQNRMLLLAHGVVKAGIDLNRLRAEDLEMDGRKISIKLPRPQITDAYLDEKETKVIDRETGLLAPSATDLEQTTRRNALHSINLAARQGGILAEAEERAKDQLNRLFRQLGFETVEFR